MAPAMKAMKGLKARAINLIKTKKDGWLKNKKKQQELANRTIGLVAASLKKCKGSSKLPGSVWDLIQKGEMFISLNDDKVFQATVNKCGTPVHQSHHLRAIDFVLQGKGSIKILEKHASNLDVLCEGDKNAKGKFVRMSVVIPAKSQPAYGTSRHFTHKSDGHRLVPGIPLGFKELWKNKADGYAKYGPTYVHSLKSFKASINPLSTARLKVKGKTIVVPMPNKTREIKGGEKVIVRGNELKLRNLQRQQILFPKQQPNNELLMESIDGYIEDIVWKSNQLELIMLVPMKEDYHALSHPIGKAHPPPASFHHHHHTYSRLFNVHPMTGAELTKLAGSGGVTLPPGTIMNTTLISAAAVGGIVGVISAATVATTTIIKEIKS